MHVVQTPGIGSQAAHRQSLFAIFTLATAPRWIDAYEVGLLGGDAVTGMKAGSRAGAGGVFPFRLGGQAVSLAGLLVT